MGYTTRDFTATHEVAYRCPKCSARLSYTIVGRGNATGSTGPWGLDPEGGREDAAAAAKARAAADAAGSVRLVRCPKCGFVDTFGRVRAALGYVPAGLFAACMSLLIGSGLVVLAGKLGVDTRGEGLHLLFRVLMYALLGLSLVGVPVLRYVRRRAEVRAAVLAATHAQGPAAAGE